MQDDNIEELVLPELTDKSMEELNTRARTIYARLKQDDKFKDSSSDDILDSAIVLGIFAVFNPKNIPMSEEQIQTVFSAYKNWIQRRVFN